MNRAVILAGGVGSRVGAEVPKQFVEILGKPVVAYTVEVFQNHPEIEDIEIVCHAGYMEYMREITRRYGYGKVSRIVHGGENFQMSVLNGITGLKNIAEPDDVILVHYAASPFVSDDILSDAIRVCQEKGNCTSATPCFLLMGSNDDGKQSTKWVNRDKYMQLNSPQCFLFHYVEQLYEEAQERGLLEQVEPHTTSLMYHMDRTIYFSKGTQTNIKITQKEDLELFEAYIRMRQTKR